ncbi:acyltransferase [Piedraia hortae CBS 480.64]|uniref:Acyltransferase n=1 Tax=Piedraia hortae CBS 480.64 TaxID=1314780 RepID=A0A6A7C2S5_9PEZI|nr:acyltransferase [Piedraia hortae CBS 480.64]
MDATKGSLLAPYARFRKDPLGALHELRLHAAGAGWRRYDDVVGQRLFYTGFTEKMMKQVLAQPKLKEKINQLAKMRTEKEVKEGQWPTENSRNRRREEIERQLYEVAETWTDQMICKFESKSFIRSAYYLCTQLLTRAYHQGIHVDEDEVHQLTKAAKVAAEKGHSIIFLPCHKSHIDYVSMQVICFRLGLGLPTVVAGDNLNFPVIGPFLQHAGAMYIRRSFGDDQLYTALVHAYVDTLLQHGYNMECFVEGGRSRTGKLLQPKFGILGILLDSVLSGQVDDAMICPVSTQYDKVIEVDSYISELLGQPKRKEDLRSFLSSSSVLSLKLGRVDVRFREPWSLKEYIMDETTRWQKLTPPIAAATRDESTAQIARRRHLLTTLGYKVLSDINNVSVVMPTALVGTVLLTLRGRGVGKSELNRRVQWLAERVQAQGGRVAHVIGLPTSAVVDTALGVLGPKLVGRIDGLPEETYYAADRFQLSFYRNMTIHLFILQSIVCAAVYTRVKLGSGPENQQLSYPELRQYVSFLSQLFRTEFIFPTTGLDENLQETLSSLEQDQVLISTRNDPITINTVALHPNEVTSGRENFDFYCFLLWPFIETSWLSSVALFMLCPPDPTTSTPPTLKSFESAAQLLGKTLYHQGELSYYESVNKEALKNAFSRSRTTGILLVDAQGRVKLDPAWMPRRIGGNLAVPGEDEGADVQPLWLFCERINQSRREGKNRRDGMLVNKRVFALIDRVGRGLFEGKAKL